MLMTYGAGSVGLNLQFASYVFLFDRWWNPAVEDQAINRAHRIGAQRPVTVTRFLAIDTIEQHNRFRAESYSTRLARRGPELRPARRSLFAIQSGCARRARPGRGVSETKPGRLANLSGCAGCADGWGLPQWQNRSVEFDKHGGVGHVSIMPHWLRCRIAPMAVAAALVPARFFLPPARPSLRSTMNSARSRSIPPLVMLIFPVVVAVATLSTPSYGFWGYGGCCGCQETWCAWSETWHAPYALETPLRGYYIPRTPGCCSREFEAGTCGCGVANAGCSTSGARYGWCYPPEAGVGFEPVQFERLGQVPNDMELGGLPTPGQQGR
jgi:hypothetical protein